MDQIRTNDYKYAFLQGKAIKEVSSYVPQVVSAIKNMIRTLIKAHPMVPESPPMGRFPRDQIHYDANNCHVGLNTFTRFHNQVSAGGTVTTTRLLWLVWDSKWDR